MPTIKEILEIERSKPDNRIVLFEEGSFMKAYERSACFLSIMYRFKLNVREYKNIGETILSAGFPASTMAQRFPHAVVSNGWCMVQVPLLPFEVDFDAWKRQVIDGEMKRQADVMTADTKRHIRCEDLKCYKATLDMLVYATQLLNHMPRELRYTLGHRTIEDIHGIMRGIYRTFYADEERKRESLDRALDSMVDVMADCRVMYALRVYNDNVNMHLAEQVATIDTNLSKWRNSLRKNAR